MNLEDIMPGQRSWSQKGKTVGFHLNEVPRVVKLTETENRLAIGAGGGGKGQLCSGCNVSVLQHEKVLKIRCVTV